MARYATGSGVLEAELEPLNQLAKPFHLAPPPVTLPAPLSHLGLCSYTLFLVLFLVPLVPLSSQDRPTSVSGLGFQWKGPSTFTSLWSKLHPSHIPLGPQVQTAITTGHCAHHLISPSALNARQVLQTSVEVSGFGIFLAGLFLFLLHPRALIPFSSFYHHARGIPTSSPGSCL